MTHQIGLITNKLATVKMPVHLNWQREHKSVGLYWLCPLT